jgi:hypothetical protein
MDHRGVCVRTSSYFFSCFVVIVWKLENSPRYLALQLMKNHNVKWLWGAITSCEPHLEVNRDWPYLLQHTAVSTIPSCIPHGGWRALVTSCHFCAAGFLILDFWGKWDISCTLGLLKKTESNKWYLSLWQRILNLYRPSEEHWKIGLCSAKNCVGAEGSWNQIGRKCKCSAWW